MSPIFIPTKGRANKTKTDKHLDALGIPYTFIIEPQDAVNYEGKRLIVMPENNQGIAYARQFILDLNRKQNNPHFWMLDDDITSFGLKEEGRTKTADASVLQKAEKLFLKYDFCINSLEYRQFAWSSKDMAVNKINFVCVFIKTDNCKNINYDVNIKIREDFDFSLQAILNGKGTLKTSKYFFNASFSKSLGQEGGMKEWYNSLEIQKNEVEKICKKYPKLLIPYVKNGLWEVKVNWKMIK